MSRDVIKKIKLLRVVEPDAAFRESNRRVLMMQIKNTLDVNADMKEENILLETLKVFFPWQIFKAALRPVLTVFLIFGLILGSGLSVSAAEASLPGDVLYPLKLVTEEIQMTLTFKDEKKTEMHVELAGKRINEVTKIKDKTDSPAAKSQKINIAVNKFKTEIDDVKTNLEALDKKAEPKKVVEVAKIIDTKVNEYQDTLQKTVADLETPVKENVAVQVNEGLDSADKTGDKALEVIVGKHVSGEVVLPENEVVERLGKKIETVENKVVKVEEQVAVLNNTSSASASSEEPAPAVSSEAEQTKAQIQETTDQAKEVLNQAKELLTSDQKDLGAVLNKVIESKELVKQAEQRATEATAATLPDETNADTNANANTNVDTNTNVDLTNLNINADVNSNTNTNANTNVDANINANTNSNVNSNVNVNSDASNINVNNNANTNTNTNTNTGASKTTNSSNVNTNTNTNTATK
jgi:hypothetical protein